jgi:hypothetical protein
VTVFCGPVNEFNSLIVLNETVLITYFNVKISLLFSQTIIFMRRKEESDSIYTHTDIVL